MNSGSPVEILYYTDILCIWAYAAQIRIDELKKQYGDRISIRNRFVSVFGSTDERIGRGWENRGGYDGFSDHVIEVAAGFPHIDVNPAVWRSCRPRSSATSHLFVKAAQLLQGDSEIDAPAVVDLEWRIRCAFFMDARDIGETSVLVDIADCMGLPGDRIRDRMLDGSALAGLSVDMEHKTTHQLQGSPTLLMNNGRQKLYGNVGYRVMEANVAELLENPEERASWC